MLNKKITLICDSNWFEKYEHKELLKYDECITIDYKSSTFSYIIFNEIYKRQDEYIIIISNRYKEKPYHINVSCSFVSGDTTVIYSKNMDSFDFTKISTDCFISIPGSLISKKVTNRNFNSILSLQKYLISYASNVRKFSIYVINHTGNVINVETDEDKLLKNNRRKNKRTKKPREVPIKDYIKPRTKVTTAKKINEKPKLLIITDVKGWAWWIKSNYLKKYLDPYYDVDIKNVIDNKSPIDYKKYDLYFTYGYSYVNRIMKAPYERRIAGITAHRPLSILKQKMSKVGWSHANSVLLYNDLTKIHDMCFYVPNGVDEKLFRPEVPILHDGDNLIIGHVGKLSPRKGQQQFIEPAIAKSDVKYFSHYNNYKSKINHKDMPKIHNKYDIFICASEEDGTPCPALEAAACGRPIISNKIGNMPELIENYKTGILLEKRDVDLYVDAIKWCQKNPEKVREMGQNIRKKIETEWTWELMARNYLYMFDTILGIERNLSDYMNPAQFHIE